MYDGLNPVTLSGNLQLASQNLDEVFAQVSSGGITSYLRDGLNSTMAVANGGGIVTGNYTYSPYGDSVRGGTESTPLQYTGRDNDGATGLYYYRARYYSSSLGRFISEDPIGLVGGANFYSYVGGNPIGNRDLLGLWSISGSGYWPFGGEITLGYDHGHMFITGRVGVGSGGGVSWDKDGGVPGGTAETGCHGGAILSSSGKAALPERRSRMAKEMQASYVQRMRDIAQRAKTAPQEGAELDARIGRLRERLKNGDPDLTSDELQAAVERAEAKRRELDTARPTVSDGAQILSVLPKAAEYYGQQIALGLDGDPDAAMKARPIVRELLGGKVDLVPGEDGSLWAEYGLHMTALLRGAGTCGRDDRI